MGSANKQEKNMKNLIAFIESHGNKVISCDLTRITAECVYTKDGKAFTVQESFPATLSAARDWLGY